MSQRANPGLLLEIQKYGAPDISACFNCGNCTAVCPLAGEGASFPRRIIRYAQVGLKERLLAAPDLWLCYACGECSTTCPRQAEPGEFMAAARRFAIASDDVTGLAGVMVRRAWINVLANIALTLFFALYLLSFRQPTPAGRLALFQFVPEVYVQVIGLAIFGVIGLAMLSGTWRMWRRLAGASGLTGDGRRPWHVWRQALWDVLVVEALGQRRYRQSGCEEEQRPWYQRQWLVHLTILYGFLGLFAATALDFLFKPVGSAVPLYYPMRLLGTSAGLLLMCGASAAMLRRLQKRDRSARQSHISDWMFLIQLWLVGLTGFLLELAVYALLPALWGYALLIVHVALAMDLLLMLPFGKFNHAHYRTAALLVHRLQAAEPDRAGQPAPAEA